MLTLLGAAVRFAIASSPTHVATGLRIIASESFRTLAEVAPAIWTPSCSRDLANRAVLLPTVDHALSCIGGVHARSDILRAKMAEVQRRAKNGQHNQGSSGMQHSKAHLEGSRIAIQLWRVLQHTLLDGEGANKLPPLREAVPKPSADDENLMSLKWDLRFDNHNDEVMDDRSLCSDTIPEFSEDDMLATWEEDRLSQMEFDNELFVADQPFTPSVRLYKTSNLYLQHEGPDSPVWSPYEFENQSTLSVHISCPLDLDPASWDDGIHGCEEWLEF
jgi:hypothetical protein